MHIWLIKDVIKSRIICEPMFLRVKEDGKYKENGKYKEDMGMFLERFYEKFSKRSLDICVDHSLKNTKKLLQVLWPLITLILPITPYSCRPSLILYISVCAMFCEVQIWTRKLQLHCINLPRTFPEDWNCPNLLGTFWKHSANVMW